MERGDITKIVISVFLFLFLVFLGTQIYTYKLKAKEAKMTNSAIASKLKEAEASNAALKAELEYYANPENMEKEVKGRFNYRDPGEKTLILVPQASGTSEQ